LTPAGIVVWYYETRDGLGAPGLNFIDSTGRVYDKSCESCGFIYRNCNKESVWVCGKCGKPWLYEDHFILKGEVQTPNPPDVFERQNARWVDIGVILHRLLGDAGTHWDMRLYIATCHGFKVDPRKDANEESEPRPPLAAMFQELWPEAPGPWSRATMFRRVKRAKQAFERKLEEAGINFS
jgi:hypothetical protein